MDDLFGNRNDGCRRVRGEWQQAETADTSTDQSGWAGTVWWAGTALVLMLAGAALILSRVSVPLPPPPCPPNPPLCMKVCRYYPNYVVAIEPGYCR